MANIITGRSTAWFKFYPRDWIADLDLHDCSLSARGLWIELIAMMYLSPEPGTFKKDDIPKLASRVRASENEVKAALKELEDNRVFDVNGADEIVCRKIIKDLKYREQMAQYGKKGVRAKAMKQKGNDPQAYPSRVSPSPDSCLTKNKINKNSPLPPQNGVNPLEYTTQDIADMVLIFENETNQNNSVTPRDQLSLHSSIKSLFTSVPADWAKSWTANRLDWLESQNQPVPRSFHRLAEQCRQAWQKAQTEAEQGVEPDAKEVVRLAKICYMALDARYGGMNDWPADVREKAAATRLYEEKGRAKRELKFIGWLKEHAERLEIDLSELDS